MTLYDLLLRLRNKKADRRIIVNSPSGNKLLLLDKGTSFSQSAEREKTNYELVNWEIKSFTDTYVRLDAQVSETAAEPSEEITLREFLTTFKRWETERTVILVDTEDRVKTIVKFDMGDKLENYFLCEDRIVHAWKVEKYNQDRDMYITFRVMVKE